MSSSEALNITRGEAQHRRAAIHQVHAYEIDLDLSVEGDVFGSRTRVTFQLSPEAQNLLATEPLFIDFVADAVTQISLNGTSLDPTDHVIQDGTRILLPTAALSFDADATQELVIEGLARYSQTGEGLHRFVDPADGETYLYSQFEVPDSRRVFAVFEQPDLKATFQFTVTAPDHWTVVSNQPTPDPVQAEQGEHLAVWAFTPTPRLSSYVTAIVAGPYHRVDAEQPYQSTSGREIPMGVFCRASLAEYLDADNILEITVQGFEYFEREYGVPYPFDKYDQLFVPEFNAGAMENAGAVTFLEDYVFRSPVAEATVERRAITILHEMAHMWFGDLVTMRWWNDLWLNESFAEFMSHIAAVNNTRFEEAWTTFAATEKNWAYRQDQLSTTHPIVADIADLNDVLVNFDGITYAKGASVLRQLVAYVGHDQFMTGVRTYFEKHAYGNTELKDLLVELEAASGRELTEWSKVWLETSGVNALTPRLQVSDEGVIDSLQIVQSSATDSPLRPHRLVVGFYNVNASDQLVRTDRFELDVTGEVTEVTEAAGTPRPAVIIVNDEDLTYATLRLDSQSLEAVGERLSTIPDSLARAVLWGSLWDMTRDAEVSAEWFITTALRHIGSEDQSSLLFNLLRQLNTALNQFVPEADQARVRQHSAEKLWELATQADAGSDLQLQFAKAFITHARGEQLDRLQELYDLGADATHEDWLPQLQLSTDLRWEILASLVAGGRAGEAEIAAAEQADKSAAGALSAVRARAAVPTPENKRTTWKTLVEGSGTLSNMTQRYMVMGFNRVHNPEDLLAEFVEQYYQVIDTVWASGSHEMAETFAVGLFPSWKVTQQNLDAVTTALQTTEHSALQRVLKELRDDVQRALTARSANK